MCGIVGRVNWPLGRKVDAQPLVQAMALMAHRGPDGEGIYLHENAGLGHRRLAIVDLAGGAQPMPNEDQTVWVTFNGEIYNHPALRQELSSRGHVFATRSDTEVLVHGYEEWGKDLVGRLRGMFAFAVWDKRERRLLLARDRLGIKPIYWTRVGADLVFASEIKGLLAFADVRRELNEPRLTDYLALRYVPGPETLFADILRLQPGHLLSFKDGEVQIERYWEVPVEAPPGGGGRSIDEMEEAHALTQLLLESVRLRLMADVPVGVFLSGGIDSTAVAWAMKQADPSALKSFAVGFEGDSEGELRYARLAAEAIGTEHREVIVDSEGFLASLEDLAWHLDEPLSDGACIPLMHLAKRAREEVVVVLSGEGADEVLAGYPIYPAMLFLEKARALGGTILSETLALSSRGPWRPKLRRWLDRAAKPLEKRYLGVGRAFDDNLIAAHLGTGALDGLLQRLEPFWQRTRGLDPLHRMLYLDTAVWLPDDLLIKADKTTMAWSIELRVPFLDHELVESAWELPAGLKLKGRRGKHLLRIAMADKLPAEILTRPKRGFPVPLTRWLRGPLHGPCREQLLAAGSISRSLLGARSLQRLLEEHASGAVDRREELYALWILELWHRAFLGAGARERLAGAANTELREGGVRR
jgi:asparagine synthase (glutamine-hydrolysing)